MKTLNEIEQELLQMKKELDQVQEELKKIGTKKEDQPR